MDTDLKKLIDESLQEFFESAPAKMVEKGTRPEYFDVCPHCKKEIYEKHEYTEDGGKTWRHSDCKGLISRPSLDPSEIPSWLRPYIDQAKGEQLSEGCNEAAFRIYNNTLCPKLWDENQHLDPVVRLNLLRMAYDFYKKTKFTAPIIDVWFMGSAANYNWTPESDADVHIIIDFSKLKMPNETAAKVAKSAGAQWNNEHNAYVKDHKVEINIQSVKAEKPHITGIYSLVKDEWVRKPSHLNVKVDKSLIQSKYAGMKKYIETVISSGDRERMKAAKDYLDAFRQYGLDTGGELSIENIVYKILRSKELVKALKTAITAAYDKDMSVDEAKEDEARNVQSEHFKITFGHPDLSKTAGKIFFGNEWFANVYPNAYYNNEWAINAHQGAFRMGFKSPPYTFSSLDKILSFLEEWISKRAMNEEKKVTYKDIPAKFPLPPALWKGQPNLRMMTLSNLKSERDKSGRMAKAYMGHEDKSLVSYELKQWKMYDDEIKRRLKYINSPVVEGNNPDYNANVDFLERHDTQMCEIAQFLKENPGDKPIPWKTISASLLKKTWLIFGKRNIVNENAIDKIADQILTNIARLYVSNEFTGHSTNYHMREEVADHCGIEFTEEEWGNNSWRFENISDYGMEPLQKIYGQIFNADTPEEKLYACDRALNVVHQRSDLAEIFVEGGTATLNAIASQGGYDAGYSYGDVNKMMRSIDESSEVTEGYGAGIPETDRLHIPNHRWQIRSKDAPKTPKMTKEEEKIVDDIVESIVKAML